MYFSSSASLHSVRLMLDSGCARLPPLLLLSLALSSNLTLMLTHFVTPRWPSTSFPLLSLARSLSLAIAPRTRAPADAFLSRAHPPTHPHATPSHTHHLFLSVAPSISPPLSPLRTQYCQQSWRTRDEEATGESKYTGPPASTHLDAV